MRVVYDGSAKPSGCNQSLNDCLQTGPNYTPQLFDTLVRFRWHKIGLTADIEKAFLMVGINEADKDMLRFLWFNYPVDINSDIIHSSCLRPWSRKKNWVRNKKSSIFITVRPMVTKLSWMLAFHVVFCLNPTVLTIIVTCSVT